ncbi:hypothetical protein [Streptococcus equi]|uniref:hypothetical protein n=1 Tax=Streptococcus equi TaxID=1336 RepID=UPI001E44A0F1|nr:hypothetical protein [Streptococcus equi]
MFYLLLPPLICSVVFLAVYIKEPRTLWLGASFVTTLGVSLLCAMIYIFSIEEKASGSWYPSARCYWVSCDCMVDV